MSARDLVVGLTLFVVLIYVPSIINLIFTDKSYCWEEFPSFTCISSDFRKLAGIDEGE